jgi:hypothetical protein
MMDWAACERLVLNYLGEAVANLDVQCMLVAVARRHGGSPLPLARAHKSSVVFLMIYMA